MTGALAASAFAAPPGRRPSLPPPPARRQGRVRGAARRATPAAPPICHTRPIRRRSARPLAIPLTARPPPRVVATPDTCPVCGGESIRRAPLLDRIKGVGIPAVGGSLKTRKSCETYLKCHGCTVEFVYAERGIEQIMNGLLVEDNIPDQIEYYYKEAIEVPDLLTKHRTAIIRRVHVKRSLLGVSSAKKELIICFKYKGIRTFGSFIRETDSRRRAHYVFKELSMA